MAKRGNKPTVYYFIIILTMSLLGIGLIMIASSSSVLAYLEYEDSFHFLWRQAVFTVIGILGLGIALRTPRSVLKSLSPIGIFVSFILLLMVLGFGEEANGARRWLMVAGFRFQPSEFVKLAVILFTADILSRRRKNSDSLVGVAKPLGIPIMIMCGLIMLQPDLGTTLIILASVFIMFFLSEIRMRELFALAASGLGAISVLITIRPYQLDRVRIFLDPWADARGKGFQLVQSLMAFGSGGWTGVGLGMSRQKFGYLPAPYTDFIFAVIGEELGLLGTLSVVLLYVLLAVAVIDVIRRQRDQFDRLLAGGIGFMIIGQAFINMGGVTSLMPLTGVPLPLISFGGTSLILTLTSIGVLLNLAAGAKYKKKGIGRADSDMRGRNGRARLSRSGSGRSA